MRSLILTVFSVAALLHVSFNAFAQGVQPIPQLTPQPNIQSTPQPPPTAQPTPSPTTSAAASSQARTKP
jgi:hypothetical protein